MRAVKRGQDTLRDDIEIDALVPAVDGVGEAGGGVGARDGERFGARGQTA